MHRRTAAVSLDMDNLWSYLKIHGDPEWEGRPSYIPALVPRILELFGSLDVRATVFVVGADAAREDGAKAVSSLQAAGHEVANHSYEHEPWLHTYGRSALEAELVRTEEAIVSAGAPRPVGFRGPGYSLSPTLLELLSERGYTYDASTLPTWIGPLARAYYFRGSGMSKQERRQRAALFGSAAEGLRPVHPYRWRLRDGAPGPVELPVTTIPIARVPMHMSYVLQLHQISPRLARAYFRAGLRTCLVRRTAPSILVHPLDLLDHRDAPGLEFFPGMALRAQDKAAVLDWALCELRGHYELVGTGEHVRRLVAAGITRTRPASGAGPRRG